MERLLLVMAFNALSYVFIGRHRLRRLDRSVDIVTIRDGKRKDQAIYIIGGMCCRTEKPFSYLIDRLNEKIPDDVPVYLVEYVNHGLSLRQARKAIKIHRKENRNKRASFLVVSMGYQLVAGVAKKGDRVIAICPCVGLITLQPTMAFATFFLLLPLRLVVLAILGWFQLLPFPFVKIDGPAYSIQLLLDQLSVCGSWSTLLYEFSPDVLIVGKKDSLVNNGVLGELQQRTKTIRSGIRPFCDAIRKIAETAGMPDRITKAIPMLTETKKQISTIWVDSDHFGINGNEGKYLQAAVDHLFC